MPSTIALRAMFEDDEWCARVRAAVAKREEAARAARARRGNRVLGRAAVRRVSPRESARTFAPRRALRPVIACKDTGRRIVELERLTAFRIAYAAARRRFAGGDREVEFPVGTYRLRTLGVRCVAWPPEV
jgi:hypothetical protein